MKRRPNLIQLCLLCATMLSAVTAGAQPVTSVAAGWFHSLFLKGDGSLWAMGENSNGQLGDGTTNRVNRPERIVAGGVTAIAAGAYHSLFLKSDGSLWGMGGNGAGQLGNGTFNDSSVPGLIVAGGVTAIAAGSAHSLYLTSDGSLWAMGYNGDGALGDGTYATNAPNNGTDLPERIVTGGVVAIAAGVEHSLFLKSDGSLWAMGENYRGQLGDGNYNNTNQPCQAVAANVTVIAAGDYHTLFLQRDGSLWAVGQNNQGQLGDGTYFSGLPYGIDIPEQILPANVTAIAGGSAHSLLLKNDGSLWSMGWNYGGQLGTGRGGFMSRTATPGLVVPGGVRAIAAGSVHSLFVKDDGSLWAMGGNSWGQLGNGTFTTNSPIGANFPELIVAGPPGYNQLSVHVLGSREVGLSYVGIAGANYALDRSTNLAPPDWVPQATNSAGAGGVLVFTNTPDPTVNNFWRIRSVP